MCKPLLEKYGVCPLNMEQEFEKIDSKKLF